ncbi:MAG: hypothetical protein LKE51_07570 [Selenomonas sp.]|nr:hypothetical protein [Selenomonas sp.]
MMLIISVVAFLLLFLAANYIIREITSALKQMIIVCRALKDGDFRNNGITLERGDELGRCGRHCWKSARISVGLWASSAKRPNIWPQPLRN